MFISILSNFSTVVGYYSVEYYATVITTPPKEIPDSTTNQVEYKPLVISKSVPDGKGNQSPPIKRIFPEDDG